MAERPIDANAIAEAIEKINPVDYGSMFSYEAHGAAREVLDDVKSILTCAPTINAIVLPCEYGAKLYKVTHPYRQEPKITEFVAVNFRTAGKRHILQVEVRVNGMPGTNWLPYKRFHLSKEEAEAELVELRKDDAE